MDEVIARRRPMDIDASPQIRYVIKQLQPFHARPNRDLEGNWQIGYGHHMMMLPYDEIKETAADRYLENDIYNAATTIWEVVTVNLQQCEFDALISFHLSVTDARFRQARLLQVLNHGGHAGMPGFIRGWCNIRREYSKELNKRRIREARVWSGTYE